MVFLLLPHPLIRSRSPLCLLLFPTSLSPWPFLTGPSVLPSMRSAYPLSIHFFCFIQPHSVALLFLSVPTSSTLTTFRERTFSISLSLSLSPYFFFFFIHVGDVRAYAEASFSSPRLQHERTHVHSDASSHTHRPGHVRFLTMKFLRLEGRCPRVLKVNRHLFRQSLYLSLSLGFVCLLLSLYLSLGHVYGAPITCIYTHLFKYDYTSYKKHLRTTHVFCSLPTSLYLPFSKFFLSPIKSLLEKLTLILTSSVHNSLWYPIFYLILLHFFANSLPRSLSIEASSAQPLLLSSSLSSSFASFILLFLPSWSNIPPASMVLLSIVFSFIFLLYFCAFFHISLTDFFLFSCTSLFLLLSYFFKNFIWYLSLHWTPLVHLSLFSNNLHSFSFVLINYITIYFFVFLFNSFITFSSSPSLLSLLISSLSFFLSFFLFLSFTFQHFSSSLFDSLFASMRIFFLLIFTIIII
ncbi:unnamed protein product [Acanthosepion pharaonis]|uniref:Uncharacterized protein n=1 Tax=Acanthosepion pharaonis TaxID=158019 RepID=A0A812BW32_ACAPH|nr:unnamed protein product [Sepia pharaonis]